MTSLRTYSVARHSSLDLHAPPHGERKPGQARYIFQTWPRPPDGDGTGMFEKHPEYGKHTSNNCLFWGETLYDFYRVFVDPVGKNIMLHNTGSRIADYMRAFGELDTATGELDWAVGEGDPTQVFPCDVGRLIRDRERQLVGCDPSGDFTKAFLSRAPTLQARIPFHLLPEKLIVHDPWNTLSVTNVHLAGDNNVYTFDLSLSEEGMQKQRDEREAAEAADKTRMESNDWRIIFPPVDKPGLLEPDEFAIYAKIPPRPPRPTSIHEAHLYIRREDKCGSGNHSVVYFSELELPRWAVVDDELCEECFQIALDKEIDEREKAGTLRPDDTERRGERGEIKHIKTVVEGPRSASLIGDDAKTRHIQFTCTSKDVLKEEYTGPIAYVYPKYTWRDPEHGPVCEHQRIGGLDPPLTTRVKVCAKLSFQGDPHLAEEAKNYQAFPSYFFEHWNGYNVVYPLRDPTPCGALVPQFYGYYVPKGLWTPVDDETGVGPTSDSAPKDASHRPLDDPSRYHSPILLLVHCGVPVELDDLSQDDRHTCAALYFLFFKSGWTQNSMAERNVVVQSGPISEWPAFRGMDRRQRHFRLIDFGRATIEKEEDHIMQREDVYRLFKLMQHAPFVPLST